MDSILYLQIAIRNLYIYIYIYIKEKENDSIFVVFLKEIIMLY